MLNSTLYLGADLSRKENKKVVLLLYNITRINIGMQLNSTLDEELLTNNPILAFVCRVFLISLLQSFSTDLHGFQLF